MKVGNVIRQLRNAAGVSQQDFATRVEITPSYLSLVETGKREATVALLRKMSEALGTPAALLIAAALVDTQGDAAGQEEERAVVHHLVEAARQLLIANQMDLKLLHAGAKK